MKEKDSPSVSPEERSGMTVVKSAPIPMTQEEVEAMAVGGGEGASDCRTVINRVHEGSSQTCK